MFAEGDLYYLTQTMINTELTLDQLKAVAGGVQMGPDGKGCSERDFNDFSPFGKMFNDLKWLRPQKSNDSVLSAPSEGVSLYDH